MQARILLIALTLAWMSGLPAGAETSLHPITRAYPDGLRSPFAPPPVPPPGPLASPQKPEPPQIAIRPQSRPDLVLAGVVRSRRGATALVVEDGTTRILRTGDTLGEYRVARIGERSLDIAGPGGSLTLKMD